ncbi:MAG: alpha/beta hydrolase [Solirubrobacterales bacterium]
MSVPLVGGGLECVVREPTGEGVGALVLMHGRATDQHDLAPLLDIFDPDQRLLGLAPGGPFTDMPPGGRHWYAVERVGYPEAQTFSRGYGALTDFLDSTLQHRGISWSEVVVGGFSQGAVMSYAVGLGTARPKPAGILAMSGFVPTTDAWVPELESRKGLPVWISHGELDPVISVDLGRRARDLLSRAGLDVTYHETRMAHTIDPRLMPEIQAWIGDRLRG